MLHQETKRIVPGARFAVLFLHGIVGSPAHFRQILDLESRVPADISLWNLRLPGHGFGAAEFGASSGSQWREYVWNAFRELAQSHEKVFLVGHSMGTLFSLQLEKEFSEKIAGMLLLNVPLRIRVKPWCVVNSVRLCLGCVPQDRPREAAILTACGVSHSRNLFRYIGWIPRFLDLFGIMGQTEKILTEPSVPYQIIQSRQDELVSGKTEGILRKKGLQQIRVLEESSHFYYPPEENQVICDCFRDMLQTLFVKS